MMQTGSAGNALPAGYALRPASMDDAARRQRCVYEKELRPGRDLSTQSLTAEAKSVR